MTLPYPPGIAWVQLRMSLFCHRTTYVLGLTSLWRVSTRDGDVLECEAGCTEHKSYQCMWFPTVISMMFPQLSFTATWTIHGPNLRWQLRRNHGPLLDGEGCPRRCPFCSLFFSGVGFSPTEHNAKYAVPDVVCLDFCNPLDHADPVILFHLWSCVPEMTEKLFCQMHDFHAQKEDPEVFVGSYTFHTANSINHSLNVKICSTVL